MTKTPIGLQEKIKNLIQEKNNVQKNYQNSKINNNIQYLRRFKLLQKDLHNAIEVSKLNYHSRITCELTHIQKKNKMLLGIIKKAFE